MTALFDVVDYQTPTHGCAGDVCQVCELARTPADAKTLGTARPKKDNRWWTEAGRFINQLGVGALFTADDLVELIGLPDGSPNQVGACVRAWAAADLIVHHDYEDSRRKSNHGRIVRVWRKA